MEKITSHQVLDLMEAYQSVYVSQEDLNEELIWEEVEFWVNSLLEEGYDLSDYSWEEMYEGYLNEVLMTGNNRPTKLSDPLAGATRAVGNAARSTGNAVGNAARSTGNAVGNAARSTGNAVRNTIFPRVPTGTVSGYGGGHSSAAGAPVKPKIGSLPSSARQVTQYPQGVSTGVGGGNAGASRPTGAPVRPTGAPARPTVGAPIRPTVGAPVRPTGAPVRPAAAPIRPTGAPVRPAAAPIRPTVGAPVRPAAPTMGNPPLAPKPLPPIMGKPSLASQAAELRNMRKASQQRTIAQGGTPATSLVQSFDPFDVVLGHLIDEGYADNEESALQIMTNMSEEWREDILDEARQHPIMSVKSPSGEERSKIRKGAWGPSDHHEHETTDQTSSRRFSQFLRGEKKKKEDDMNAGRATVSARSKIRKLNAAGSGHNSSGELDRSDGMGDRAYKEVDTDYRARKLRASGR